MSRSGLIAFIALPSPARLFGAAMQVVLAWETRRRMRTDLARLDPHLLRDIGVNPDAAMAEASKPFWRD